MKKTRSIVTGGSGFIGSHIVDQLIKIGHEVIVIDNESSPSNDYQYRNNQAEYYVYDIADYDLVRPLFDNIDYVFHLAAEARIQNAINNPVYCVNTNAVGTAVVLESAKQAGVKKVIYSSTSSSYGLKNKIPLKETMEEDCLNPYSISKVAGEKLCKIYNDLYGLKTITLRYFNVYGPREPMRGPYAPVVGLFLRQRRAEEPLTIVGSGHQRRDFTYIDDVVRANIMAMEYSNDQYHGTVFNVGTGRNYSILEIASMISDHVRFIDPRPAEAFETLADISKINREFGWLPSVTIESYIRKELENT
jgi:UDP-glucose 4-epimerase